MWGELFNPDNPLIGAENTWALWAVMVLCAGISIILEQRYKWASRMTGCVIALILAIVLSNLGVIPLDSPVWDVVWSYVVPLAIPFLLMQCDIRKIGKGAGRILIIFLIGSVGTIAGSLIGFSIFKDKIPELAALSGAFTGTYIGGSLNLVALSASFDISQSMISAATVADNLLMCLYFFVLVAIPTVGFFRKHFPSYGSVSDEGALQKNTGREGQPLKESTTESSDRIEDNNKSAEYWQGDRISLKDIALGVAISFTVVAVSHGISNFLGEAIAVHSVASQIANTLFGNLYLWITTISVILASVKPGFFGNVPGCKEIGTYLIHLFFFVIGVPASISMILANSPLLLLYAAIIILVNMLFCFVGGKILGFNIEEIILASNANIGGPTTAAAMAVSKGWGGLVAPVMLVGTLGYVLGTYLGLLVGTILGL